MRTLEGAARASGNKQTEWVSSSFRGDFVFKPPSTSCRLAAATG